MNLVTELRGIILKLRSCWDYNFMSFWNKIKIILITLIVIVIVGWVILIFNIYRQSIIDEAGPADAIVVLGAAQWDGEPSPIFKTRLNSAFDLYKIQYAPYIILTGGIGKGENISEALVGKQYLIEKGMTKDAIFIEEISHTTWQSLNQIKQLVEEQKIRTIILVSDGFHMFRLKKMADDLGINALASPVKSSPIKNQITKFKYIIRESWCYVLYLLFEI